MTPNIEQDLEASLADLDTTREQETSKTWMQQAENSLGATISGATGSDKPNGEPGGIAMWIAKLPKNISVGLIDAAVNTADAVKAFAGAAPPVWEPASKITTDAKAKEAKAKTQPESPLDQVYAEYPSLKQYGFQFQDSPKKPGDMRKLEFYPPGESDSTFADKSKPGIDRFDPSMGKADVLGEMLHYLPSVDPAVKQIRTQFQASITPEQADKWLKGDYQNEVKGGVYGAKPPTYEDWLQKQGGDALFRGYLSKQFPEEAYTPEQKTLLDHLGQQLKSPPAALGESGIYDNAKQGVMNFRDYLTQGDGTSDEVTQAISQYAIPFLGYSKLIGGLHSATMLGSMAKAGVAEAATAATVLKPHDPRAADILQLGKHVEGKFGDAMNTIAPDGSLLNHYINYMTDRSNESDAEGRFKNVVDNLALSAAAAGLIKTTAMTLKGGFATAKYALENAGTGPRGLAAQKGMVDMFGAPVPNPPVSHNVDQSGQHMFESPSGGLLATEDATALRIKYIHVKEDARGQGEGQAMMRAAIGKAQAAGKVVQSDFVVSPSQQKVYSKLAGEGYEIKKNPSHVEKETGNLVTDTAGVPVYEISATPPTPERRQEINKQMRAKAELAPAKGAGVVQTGKDHYTIFVDRKPQGSYQTEARANEELDALKSEKK